MSKAAAWGLVAGQFALLVALVFVPPGSLWSRGPIVWGAALVFLAGGVIVGVVGGWHLGKNLTPNPIPREGGTLETGGAYRWVRHPIYLGVLLVATGLLALAASWVHLAIFFSLVMLLGIKARAEERLLREQFPTYREYQAVVGRFVPGIGRIPLSN